MKLIMEKIVKIISAFNALHPGPDLCFRSHWMQLLKFYVESKYFFLKLLFFCNFSAQIDVQFILLIGISCSD